jgi:outer membrane immunogenic protein
MKTLVSASALALALAAGSAFAADLPYRKEPPVYLAPAPVPAWTGFYVGLNAGGTFGNSSGLNTTSGDLFDDVAGAGFYGPTIFGATSAASAVSNISSNNSGFIGGGQAGYNLQFANAFVAGLEADIQGLAGSSGNGNAFGAATEPASGVPLYTITNASKSLDYLGTVRGRIGLLIAPTFLAYATGGLAYGGANFKANVLQAANDPFGAVGPAFGQASFSDTRVGYTAGAGVEWLFAPHWSAKVEYLYYDLGSVAVNTALVGQDQITGAQLYGAGLQSSTRFDGHIVRAGLNYHFNSAEPPPIMAKY